MGRRKARKTLPLGEHACRDRQFQIIAAYRDEFLNSPDPIISVDTKHKEFLGLLFRIGRLYARQAKKALDHDFPSAAISVIYPHGIYDLKRNLGHLNLGLSHDTSRFAGDSVTYWWQTHGCVAYPAARRLLFLCDGGGSNASHRYVFKYHLEQLANRTGLEVRVAHYPPHCSKYNVIEHRLFGVGLLMCEIVLLDGAILILVAEHGNCRELFGPLCVERQLGDWMLSSLPSGRQRKRTISAACGMQVPPLLGSSDSPASQAARSPATTITLVLRSLREEPGS